MRSALPGLALAALLFLVGCGEAREAPRSDQGSAAPIPQRIVAVAPSSVELLFALGLGERVVGVGDFTSWPPAALELPTLGGLVDADLESLVALAPDLLVALPSEGKLADQVSALGIEVLSVDTEDLEGVEAAAAAIARRFEMESAGESWRDRWRQELAPYPSTDDPPRVLLSIGRPAGPPREVLSAGPGSFVHELLTRLGAVNVMADAPVSFPMVNLEEVLGRAPDVILELRAEPADPALQEALRADWATFPQLPAVRGQGIAVLSGSHTMVPGPRLPQLYREMAAALGLEAPETERAP